MVEIFVVTGSFQHDEESGHWNVAAFTDAEAARAAVPGFEDRAREYLPKYYSFIASIPQGTGWEETARLRTKALRRLRERVGDPGLVALFDMNELRYGVETVELY